ncbi:hypothetical protein [Urbanus proteus nucleopolyhedrovirus]|uniref:Ac52 n=1 Tax=Urbanus proteus nucleopolyhedrovirus TaxID=1675866 RepID=A0A162GUJ5_9ABAC|nr:hypothetical protein [Urbanus proteus nucleopolyhedrovirus]AKR17348.1 hypothetical protein [Urbanus proteus nucleopolyhedrovirus]
MELIKPFLKYSKLYRTSGDKLTKQKIYNKWFNEIKYYTMTSLDAHCEYCFKFNQNNIGFCQECLYPLNQMYPTIEDILTYCLLSVCFYETTKNDTKQNGDILNLYKIYQERIKVAHSTFVSQKNFYKRYVIVDEICAQCKNFNYKHTKMYNDFSLELFCNYCLFPLFE